MLVRIRGDNAYFCSDIFFTIKKSKKYHEQKIRVEDRKHVGRTLACDEKRSAYKEYAQDQVT